MSMNLVSLEEAKKPCVDVSSFPISPKILDEMYQVMQDNKGVGLAAPQVGIFQRFFIFDLGHGRHVVCNPTVDVNSLKHHLSHEGCLTIPGEKYWVKRFTSIRLTAQNEYGKLISWQCKGLLADLIQHEISHLYGQCIKDTGTK